MIPDVRHLHLLERVAKLGSFRRAALELGIDQSSISRRIVALEERLGVRLFDRSHRGARITAVGTQFLLDAGIAIEHLRKAVEVAQVGGRGRLTIGIVAALNSGVLRKLLHQHLKAAGEASIKLRLGTISEHLDRLRSGEIDVAFLPEVPETEGFEARCLWREAAVVALPDGHRLADALDVSWEDLKDHRLIFTTRGIGPHIQERLVQKCRKGSTAIAIETYDVGRDDLMAMVGLGFGIAITTGSILGASFPGVTFRAITRDDDGYPCSAVWAVGNKNRVLRTFLARLEALRENSR